MGTVGIEPTRDRPVNQNGARLRPPDQHGRSDHSDPRQGPLQTHSCYEMVELQNPALRSALCPFVTCVLVLGPGVHGVPDVGLRVSRGARHSYEIQQRALRCMWLRAGEGPLHLPPGSAQGLGPREVGEERLRVAGAARATPWELLWRGDPRALCKPP